MARPAGTVTFLFTDIEGSTRLWQDAPDAMAPALARHDAIVRGAIEAHHGQVFATGGDGFAAVFERASDAVAAARDAQAGLAEEPWPPNAEVKARMGIHTGEAVERDGDYFGRAVNQAARLMALGHGGQVLCSATTAAVVDDLGEASDLGEHRLRDVAVPVRVFQVGHGEFPPLRSAVTAPTNLPYAPTELLGRDADVADLAALVTAQRLVTLTGTGGIGKTRLAVEVAATVADRFPDGVWFVDLTPVVEDDDLARAVAAAMGATGAVGSDAHALVHYLAQRQALLVLDNCEHVIDGAAALLDEVVAGCPEVRILATSRELLDVPAELVHWVTPLPVPEGVEGATASPAVCLFEERARAVRPPFSVTEDNAADVVEICRRLDGVPLAVELAAARVASMSPSDIRERLGERFRLLAGGRRRQDRHRTLLAAVGWSYDLLDPEAQQVFRALSVGHTYTDATLEKILDLYETHRGWEEAGQLYAAITAQQRTLALTRRSATDAIRVGLAGVRLSDRIGFDMQFSGCLETLMVATALAGQVDSARRLRSYLLTADLLAMGPRDKAYAETEAALAAAGADLDDRDHGIATRRDLLDLLDEIEAALPD